jgi:hypothetical protein
LSNREKLGTNFTEILGQATKKLVPLLARYTYLPDKKLKQEIMAEVRNLIDALCVYLQIIDKTK